MGSSNETTTSTTKPTNPQVEAAIGNLAGGLNDLYAKGPTYTGPGSTTQGGWQAALAASGNPAYASGISGALQSYGKRASGSELGINDPLYAAQRARLTDDVLTSVNGAYNQSGLFGSDENRSSAARGLGEALGGLDLAQRTESYGLQSEAAGMLPQLLQAGLMPSSIQQAIGSAQDSATQAGANAELSHLGQLSGLAGMLSGAGGSTTTQTTPTAPLWQTLLGLGLQAI